MELEEIVDYFSQNASEKEKIAFKEKGITIETFGLKVSFIKSFIKNHGLKKNFELSFDCFRSNYLEIKILGALLLDNRGLLENDMKAYLSHVKTYIDAGFLVQNLSEKNAYAFSLSLEKNFLKLKELEKVVLFSMVCRLAKQKKIEIRETFFIYFLSIIERDIKNESKIIKTTMIDCINAIGLKNKILHKKALTVAFKIGRLKEEKEPLDHLKDFDLLKRHNII